MATNPQEPASEGAPNSPSLADILFRDFKAMGVARDGKFHFKHLVTRRRLVLDEAGVAYGYDASGMYTPIDLADALRAVYPANDPSPFGA